VRLLEEMDRIFLQGGTFKLTLPIPAVALESDGEFRKQGETHYGG